MSDIAAFVVVTVTTVAALAMRKLFYKERPFLVDKDNEPSSKGEWHRAVTVLVFADPPEMWYEPKEWSHTTVLLLKGNSDDNVHDNNAGLLRLPLGTVMRGETYVDAAARLVKTVLSVDVRQPENSLHRMFTFPKQPKWTEFMECVYRGSILLCQDRCVRLSLEEIKDMVQKQDSSGGGGEPAVVFTPDTYHALLLYFQRQMDLRAKRRVLKGYSSADLEHYGLRLGQRIVFTDDYDTTRMQAVEFTLQTDDGMHPKLLFEADVILLGVSRTGKTPLSLILSQSVGLKVANVPLVVDVPPPPQIFKVNPRRVFCLTVSEDDLRKFRTSRLRRELKQGRNNSMRNNKSRKSTYADLDYIRRDLENARKLVHDHGFTEINVSGRAIEETASLIASKIRERFPEQEHGLSGSWQEEDSK